jgi:hypothetical protein
MQQQQQQLMQQAAQAQQMGGMGSYGIAGMSGGMGGGEAKRPRFDVGVGGMGGGPHMQAGGMGGVPGGGAGLSGGDSPVLMVYQLYHEVAAAMIASAAAAGAPLAEAEGLAGYATRRVITPEMLFNLLCQYGNVVRVKLLNKPLGAAMAQFAEPSSVGTLISMFRSGAGPSGPSGPSGRGVDAAGVTAFGARIGFARSKQMAIASSAHGDAYAHSRDFGASMFNRFRPGQLPDRNMHGPGPTLFFSGVPAGVDDAAVRAALVRSGASEPNEVRTAPSRDGSAAAAHSRRAGFLEFASPAAAAEALMLANNAAMEGEAGATLRLAFAQRTGGGGASSGRGGGAGAGAGSTDAATAASFGYAELGRKRGREEDAGGSAKYAADAGVVEEGEEGAAPAAADAAAVAPSASASDLGRGEAAEQGERGETEGAPMVAVDSTDVLAAATRDAGASQGDASSA